jgi:hypothetical protein
MKNVLTFLLILAFPIGLAACGSGSANPATGQSVDSELGSATSPSSSTTEDRIPVNQLVIGTLQLEDTEQAVTKDQAEELLPLWKAYRSLQASDTAAQAEVQALLNQIQSTMTAEQLDAIRAMEISPEQISALMEEYDLLPEDRPAGFEEDSPPFAGGEGIPEGGFGGEGIPGGGPGGGGFPEGGFGDGQGPRFEGEINPERMATAQAMREEGGGFNNRMGSFLVSPLIEYLEGKVGP